MIMLIIELYKDFIISQVEISEILEKGIRNTDEYFILIFFFIVIIDNILKKNRVTIKKIDFYFFGYLLFGIISSLVNHVEYYVAAFGLFLASKGFIFYWSLRNSNFYFDADIVFRYVIIVFIPSFLLCFF